MIGRVIAEQYRIETELGAGGMGTVYRGIDTTTQKTIAIKHLKPDIAQPEMIERFKREGEALRDLNHPNIVKMLAAVEDSGNHYLVMEYVAGGDLAQLLQQGQLPLEQLLTLAIDLADALTRAHKLDIIHRDLKPANVLIGDDGTLRLTDFGVAHVGSKERVTETGVAVGTLDYLAPEALQGEGIDVRADIWSFGVMLFEMLAGERPFTGDTVTQLILNIMNGSLPDLESLVPSAPIALVDLVYRMLTRDVFGRVRSVRQVGLELEDILQGRDNTPPQTRFAPPTPEFILRAKHNIPVQTTAFVGREAELAELDKLLVNKSQRLITVLAPGGMGKTRLALEAAERHLDNFADGIYFVDLTALSDAANIVNAIADATGFTFTDDARSPQQQVFDFLANKTMLLVIDNWEHVIAGAKLVTEILQIAPNVQLVNTSRVRLEQAGETLFHLSGMDFPEWETPEDAMNYAAVKLFMNSALRVQPSFELTTDNLDYVARICRLTAGMPLGIVLAASWLGMLSPAEIAEEIANGIDFLEATGSDIPERQRSIQAVFDYSWEMMSADEQAIYQQLSVFHGGFTRQAAQTVTGANLRQLMSLVNKSLLHRDVESGRYGIHELARQYASQQLQASGDANAVKTAHMTYYAQAVHEQNSHLQGKRQIEALDAIDSDFENVRAAWQWASKQEQWAIMRQMVAPLYSYGMIRTSRSEMAALTFPALEKLQNAANLSAEQELLSVALAGQSLIPPEISFSEQEALLRKAIPIAQKLGDDEGYAYLLVRLSSAISSQGRMAEAAQLAEEALNLVRTLNDPFLLCIVLHNASFQIGASGRIDEARAFAHERLAIARDMGHPYFIATTLGNMAVGLNNKRTVAEKLQLSAEAIMIFQQLGYQRGIIWQLTTKMNYLLQHNSLTEYEQDIELLRSFAHESNDPWMRGLLYGSETSLYFLKENYAVAYDFARKTLSETLASGNQTSIPRAKTYLALTSSKQGNFSDAIAYMQEAATIYTKWQFNLGFMILGYALVYMLDAQRDDIRLVELLALLTTHPDKWGFLVAHSDTERLIAHLQSTLNADTYQVAWERGQQLDLIPTITALIEEYSAIYNTA